jgi:hypothetical protein
MYKDTLRNWLYLGGTFSSFTSPNTTPNGAIFDTSSLNPLRSDAPNGEVRAVISDDEGGWFIGGSFTSVGGNLRNRIAHINSDGKVTNRIGEVGFNGSVYSLHKVGSKLYVGGVFDTFGLSRMYYGILDKNLGYPTKNYPNCNGSIRTAVADGNGGWYIGGSFTVLGDSVRNNVAQIDVNGKVTGWNPNANNSVVAIAVFNGRVFLGGSFTTIAGQARNYFAEVNTTKGAPIGLSLSASNTINVLKVNNGNLYLGGNFTTFGGLARPSLAVINLSTNTITSTSLIACSNGINTLQVFKDRIYFGGAFTTVNSISRSRLAAIDTLGNLLNWSPNSSGIVNAIEYDQGRVFVGGQFSTMNGISRNYFAVLDTITGAMLANTPQTNGTYVYSICVVDDRIYVGTSTLLSNGKLKTGLVAYDRQTLAIHQINDNICDVSSFVYTIAANENTLFVGAGTVGWKYRRGGACIDLSTKVVNFWAPTVSSGGVIYTMLKSDSGMYVGGSFTAINTITRNRIAEVDTIFGGLLTWNPNASSDVYKIIEIENKLYIVGAFSTLQGQVRNKVAMFSKGTRILTPWSPNVSSSVSDIDGVGSRLFIVGPFTTVNGVTQYNFAELDTIGAGTLQPLNPFSYPPSLNCVKILNGKIYLGGGLFSNGVQGKYRNGLVVLNLATNLLNEFTANISSGYVGALAGSNSRIYVGGTFAGIGILNRSKIAILDCSTKMPIDWEITGASGISSIDVKYNKLWLGGTFTSLNGSARGNAACFDVPSRSLLGWNPNTNGKVNKIVVNKSKVYIGGQFATVGGVSRSYIVEVDTLQGIPTSWNFSANGIVNDLLVADSFLYIGGSFTSISGQTRSYIASYKIDSALLTSWNPFANGAVRCLTLGNGVLYAGGDFNTIGSQSRNRAAALSLSTGLANSWNPNLNSYASTMSLYDSNTVIVGGDFTTVGGLARGRIASVDALIGSVNPWAPSFNQGVLSLLKSDKTTFVGGGFTTLNGSTRNSFAVMIDSCSFYKTNFSSLSYQICQNDSVALIPNNLEGNKYQWLYNNNILPNDTSSILFIKNAGTYKVVVSNTACTDTSSAVSLMVKNRPVTSSIIGSTNVLTNSTQNYSVTNTAGSIYNWSVVSGTQVSGGNSNSIQVAWGSVNTQASLKVVEQASNGCKGDTVVLANINVTPVKWLDFSAQYIDDDNVALDWRTASERNNSRFFIERSRDNKLYKKIGELLGKGTTNVVSIYRFIDSEFGKEEDLYYRIKQIDFDGNFEYSKVVNLKPSNQKINTGLSVFPNPAENTITVKGFDDEYDVYDVLGNCVIQKTRQEMLDISRFKQGIYFLVSGSKRLKFVKY